MSRHKKQVAVIGAGTSGLMALKSLKEEGFEPICFEKSSYYGGLWKYHEEDVDGVPSLMWSTSLNNSKEIGSISDFPPDPAFPNYMRHSDVMQMFSRYGKKFDLFRHIRYNQEVKSVRRAGDYSTTGRWTVITRDTKTGEDAEHVFDAVMVCAGHLSQPNIPNGVGMNSFKGDIIHTHSIKTFQDFSGKTVCVVGTGSSALDAAVEISHVAKQVYLSVRTPVWICTRHGPYGYPLDWVVYTWDHNILHKIFPRSWSNKFIQEVFLNPRFSHSLYDIHPQRGVADRDFAVNDTISSRLMNGSVVLKNDIKRWTEDGVVFHDDDGKVTRVDAVVFGTGYLWEFPFLNPNDFVTEGGPSRSGSHQHEDRNLPIPLMLFSSYIAAEKSDALIKVFCKELPSILKNINDCKKALENKTKSVARLKDTITQDLKKLELANIVLKELYKEEEVVKLEKEKEIEQLRLEISSCENAKKVMNCALTYYSKSEKALDSVAVESALYLNAQDLIHSYLILLAMNEKLIADEYEFAANFHRVKRDDLELQNLSLNRQYDAMIRQKKLDILENKCEVFKNINNRHAQSISDTLSHRMEDQLNRLQIKRWTFDVCQKIGAYKDFPLSSEDFFKSLAEIEEFIVFARQIISKLEQEDC